MFDSIFFALPLLLGCPVADPTVTVEGDGPGECSDQIDNDDDGTLDCSDSDCADRAVCNVVIDTSPDTWLDDTGDWCSNNVVSFYPDEDATDAWYRTTVETRLQHGESTATLSLIEAGGVLVSGISIADDRRVVFTPNAPLSPSTAYTAFLDYSCGMARWTFTTSSVGTAIDPAVVVGGTWLLDLDRARWIAPEGVGPLITEYLAAPMLSVRSADTTSVQLVGAVAESTTVPVAQATCAPTQSFAPADFSQNPWFTSGPQEGIFPSIGLMEEDVISVIPMHEQIVSGAFSPDGSDITGVSVSGYIDTRPLVPMLDPEGADDAICNLAITIGVQCEPCDDGGVFCLSLLVDSVSGTSIDLTLEDLVDPCAERPSQCASVCP